MKYTFFWNGPFSNFHTTKFTYKGYVFNNSEQAFMWEKATFFNDKETAALILNEPIPHQVKTLGRSVKNYNDKKWSDVRFNIMYDVCLAKFSQNESLKKMLLSKSNFVEASPYDKIWGVGLLESDLKINNPDNWKGLNLLGKVLDKVKETILNNK